MRRSLSASFSSSLLGAVFAIALAGVPAAAQGNEVLTNESVVQMVTGKVPKDLIMTKIRTTKATFDLTPEGLISLTASKVPSDMIKAMMTSAPAGTREKETLNNDAVIKMVNGQVSRDLIITKIQGSRANYDLTTAGLISLNQNKVSQEVVKAMMMASSGTPAPAPAAAPKKPALEESSTASTESLLGQGTHARLAWRFGRSF